MRRILAYIAVPAIMTVLLSKIIEQNSAAADVGLGIFPHAIEPFDIDFPLTTFLSKMVQLYDVGHRVEEQCVGR